MEERERESDRKKTITVIWRGIEIERQSKGIYERERERGERESIGNY